MDRMYELYIRHDVLYKSLNIAFSYSSSCYFRIPRGDFVEKLNIGCLITGASGASLHMRIEYG